MSGFVKPRAAFTLRFGIMLLLIALGVAILWARSSRFTARFNQIEALTTKADVLALVGKPNDILTNVLAGAIYGGAETWVYGSPFHLRFVLGRSNDYIVVFNSEGKVLRTLAPASGDRNQ